MAISKAVRTLGRILTFRATSGELSHLSRTHLMVGFVLTWMVGIGRWWEDPRASVLQHLGVGSLAYVVVLALFLWLIIWPLVPRASYQNVLSYVTLTAPPAALYAIPVRSWFDLAVAQDIRLWFLALVATWRVLLWARYLRVALQLSRAATFVVTMFPLTVIVVFIFELNLDRVVFDFMGGIRPEDATVNDSAYGVLFLLSNLSILFFIPLALAYGVLAVQGIRKRFPGARGGQGEQLGS